MLIYYIHNFCVFVDHVTGRYIQGLLLAKQRSQGRSLRMKIGEGEVDQREIKSKLEVIKD